MTHFLNFITKTLKSHLLYIATYRSRNIQMNIFCNTKTNQKRTMPIYHGKKRNFPFDTLFGGTDKNHYFVDVMEVTSNEIVFN